MSDNKIYPGGGEVMTHSDACWSWGARHYECALREIERLRDLLGKANALARIRAENLAACQADAERLRAAIERMRVAGGSHEFQAAFELAKDLL